MQMTISLSSVLSLFGVMLVLAALPSSSVLIVVTRSSAFGFIHGVLASIGIVTVDLLFILIAVLGLNFLSGSLGEYFVWIKYFGSAYLFWMAIMMWRSSRINVYGAAEDTSRLNQSSLVSSYLSGFLFTIADQKAIFFYLGLFPAFVNLSSVTTFDIVTILLVTTLAVGGVKITYAYIADQAVSLFGIKEQQLVKKIAAVLLMVIAGYIIYTA